MKKLIVSLSSYKVRQVHQEKILVKLLDKLEKLDKLETLSTSSQQS
ncbi:MAG: hypothetical protein AAB441_02640 [Patescibacteria group bacterium]